MAFGKSPTIILRRMSNRRTEFGFGMFDPCRSIRTDEVIK